MLVMLIEKVFEIVEKWAKDVFVEKKVRSYLLARHKDRIGTHLLELLRPIFLLFFTHVFYCRNDTNPMEVILLFLHHIL